jgi:hypothetical protein
LSFNKYDNLNKYKFLIFDFNKNIKKILIFKYFNIFKYQKISLLKKKKKLYLSAKIDYNLVLNILFIHF